MKNNKGFTLIELLVVLAILALIMAYAVPSYRNHVVRSKRVEAHNKLLEIAGMFEKYYTNNNAYPTALGSGGLGLTSGYLNWTDYNITANINASGNWTLTATAVGVQLRDDPPCPTITYNNLSQKGPSAACWNE